MPDQTVSLCIDHLMAEYSWAQVTPAMVHRPSDRARNISDINQAKASCTPLEDYLLPVTICQEPQHLAQQ